MLNRHDANIVSIILCQRNTGKSVEGAKGGFCSVLHRRKEVRTSDCVVAMSKMLW